MVRLLPMNSTRNGAAPAAVRKPSIIAMIAVPQTSFAAGLADLVHFPRVGRALMLFVVLVLVLLWFVGVLTKATLGGLLHILLVVAIVLGLVNFIGRRV